MRPGPAAAVGLVPEYLEIDAKPIRARELLQEIGRKEGWCANEEDLAEQAEDWETGFLRRVRTELSGLNEIGRVSHFSINSSSPDHIQGPAFIEPRDSVGVRGEKRARARLAKYLSALGALTPRDFEVLCKRTLSLLGIERVTVTGYSVDEGIDFYGVVRVEDFVVHDRELPAFVRQTSPWLLGQAKHYTTKKAATSDLRALVGSITLAKAQAYGSVGEKYEELNIRACDPVFYLFFTTGTLSAPAWRLARGSGIVALDGEMIAKFLADQEIGVTNGTFSHVRFVAWLQNDAPA